MLLVIACAADSFDCLAGALAASKVYRGSKVWFMRPPANKLRAFMDDHPNLPLPMAAESDLRARLKLAVLIGPCSPDLLDRHREMLDRAADIHLFSSCREDRDLLQRGDIFVRPVAAVTTILVEEIQRRKIYLNQMEASLLALGIYDCTDALNSPETTTADIDAVQHLRRAGIDPKILEPLSSPKTIAPVDKQNNAGEITEPSPPESSSPAVFPENKIPGGTPGCQNTAGIDPKIREPAPLPNTAETDPIAEGGLTIQFSSPEQPGLMEGDNMLHLLSGKIWERLRGKMLLLGQVAARQKWEVYLVGGIIRDLFLGREPAHDLDLVVIPEAIPLALYMQKCFGGKLVSHEQLGTATLFLSGGTRLDLATARREFYFSPGDLPEIEPSSLKFDLCRRDFTINSMACSLLPVSFGRLYDYFGGRRDLAGGVLRTMYNLSFVDDPLRILRAVRFESRFGFRLEKNTGICMQKAINGRSLEKVSRQRISQEMNNVFSEQNPPEILKRLADLGALKYIYPSLETSADTWRRLEQIKQGLHLTQQWDWAQPPDPEPAYLAGLLYNMDTDRRVILICRLYLPSDKIKSTLAACEQVPRILEFLHSTNNPAPSSLVDLLQGLPAEVLLLAYSLTENNQARECLKNFVHSFRRVQTRLTGRDLIEMGLPPGPIFRRILKELKKAVLDGRVNSLEEERNFVNAIIDREV